MKTNPPSTPSDNLATQNAKSAAPTARPPFTTPARIATILALAATAGALYWVITSDAIPGLMKLLAGCGVLLVGMLVIAAGAHFSEGRHIK